MAILFSATALAGATNTPVLSGWNVAGPIPGRVLIEATNVVLNLTSSGTIFTFR
jgi:hypothetical protein